MIWTKVYVVECTSPRHFYAGSTYRELYERIKEHAEGYGCHWTRRHGYRRLVLCLDVPNGTCSALEDELTEWLMHQYGVRNVRGGNYVNCRADCYANDWWLPKSLRSSLGNVPSLHYRPVSKFPLQLERLINAFEVFRSLQYPNHLNAQALPNPVLGGAPNHQQHVLPGQLVAPAPRAQQVPVGAVGAHHRQELVERDGNGLGELDVNCAPAAHGLVLPDVNMPARAPPVDVVMSLALDPGVAQVPAQCMMCIE